MMGYLAAPVLYIGMVQAAPLCPIGGGNATVSNLPMTVGRAHRCRPVCWRRGGSPTAMSGRW